MKKEQFEYSPLWRYRHLISFLGIGLAITIGTLYLQGYQKLIDEPFAVPFLMFVFGIVNLLGFKKESSLVKIVEIENEKILVMLQNKKLLNCDIGDIQKIITHRRKGNINQFGVKETIIETKKMNFVLTENISNYKLLLSKLNRH